MAVNDLIRETESIQYHPDFEFKRIPSFTEQDDASFEQEHAQSEMDNHITGALNEWLHETDIKVKDLIKRFVSNGHVEVPLGRLVREAIGDFQGDYKEFLGKMVSKVGDKMKAQKDEVFVVANRDLSFDDELGQKLERFKVKTVNIIGGVLSTGVVKEDRK